MQNSDLPDSLQFTFKKKHQSKKLCGASSLGFGRRPGKRPSSEFLSRSWSKAMGSAGAGWICGPSCISWRKNCCVFPHKRSSDLAIVHSASPSHLSTPVPLFSLGPWKKTSKTSRPSQWDELGINQPNPKTTGALKNQPTCSQSAENLRSEAFCVIGVCTSQPVLGT